MPAKLIDLLRGGFQIYFSILCAAFALKKLFSITICTARHSNSLNLSNIFYHHLISLFTFPPFALQLDSWIFSFSRPSLLLSQSRSDKQKISFRCLRSRSFPFFSAHMQNSFLVCLLLLFFFGESQIRRPSSRNETFTLFARECFTLRTFTFESLQRE